MTHKLIPYMNKQKEILIWISSSTFFKYLHYIFIILHYMVKRPFGSMIFLISAFLLDDIYITLNLMTVNMICYITIGSIKRYCKVPRPFWIFPELPHNTNETTYSFPSGHTIIISGLLILALEFNNIYSWISFSVISILMPVSRLYLCVHWISDVVASIIVGLLIALITYAISPMHRMLISPGSMLTYVCVFTVICFCVFVVINTYSSTLPTTNTEIIGKDNTYTNLLYVVSYISFIGGLCISWKTNLGSFPHIYNEIEELPIAIMLHMSILKLMDLVIIALKPNRHMLYCIRGIAYITSNLLVFNVPKILLHY